MATKPSKDDCPPALWRVVADVGYGWPTRTRQERKRRTFTKEVDAARWIVSIRGLPSHHDLVAVYRTAGLNDAGITWKPCDLDELVAELATKHVDEWSDE